MPYPKPWSVSLELNSWHTLRQSVVSGKTLYAVGCEALYACWLEPLDDYWLNLRNRLERNSFIAICVRQPD